MKKILAILLALALVLCMMPSAAFAEGAAPTVEVTLSKATVVYNGAEQRPLVTAVKVNGNIETTGWTTTYEESYVNAGTYEVTVSGTLTGGVPYTGKAIYTIQPIDLARATITVSGEGITNSDIDPITKNVKTEVLNSKVSVTQDGVDVKKYCSLSSAVTGTNVRVTATTNTTTGNNIITSSKFADFTVKSSLSSDYEIAPIPEQTYTGKAIEPNIVVRAKGSGSYYSTLSKGTHYTVSYSNNVNAGSNASLTVTGIGTYTGTITGKFTIGQRPISSAGINITVADAAYKDGNQITPSVTITDGEKTLEQGVDYTVSCSNTSIGSATAVITGIGNYKGQASKSFTIVEKGKELSYANTWVYVGNTASYSYSTYYNGRPQTPNVTVAVGPTRDTAIVLSPNYYNVRYVNNDKAGQATVIVTGKNGYAGSVTTGFTILPTALNQYNTTITGYSSSYAYTGLYITPQVSVSVNGYSLTQGKHYTVSYQNNRSISSTYSKAKIIITAIEGSGFTGSAVAEFTIAGKSINGCSAVFADGRTSSAYTGRAIQPKVTVRDGYYTTLREGSDYEIIYKDAAGKTVTSLVDAGAYTVEINGKGNYSGSLKLTYTITGTDISGYTVTLREDSVKGDGYSKVPTISSVTYGSTSRLTPSDYTVSYQDAAGKTVTSMSSPGTYKVVVTGRNGYSGSTSANFKIIGTPQEIKIAKTSYKVYPTSDSFKISASATGDGTGFSYVSNNPGVATVDKSGNVTIHKIGRAVITVTTTGMKKSEPASDEVYVKVHPLKTVLTQKPWNVSGKSGTIKVRWNKQEEVTKYQIRYSRNSKFTDGTYSTKTVKSSTLPYDTQSTSLSKLKKGQKYYIKVRAVKEVYNEKGTKLTYYGKWSNWRSVVVK